MEELDRRTKACFCGNLPSKLKVGGYLGAIGGPIFALLIIITSKSDPLPYAFAVGLLFYSLFCVFLLVGLSQNGAKYIAVYVVAGGVAILIQIVLIIIHIASQGDRYVDNRELSRVFLGFCLIILVLIDWSRGLVYFLQLRKERAESIGHSNLVNE